MSRRRKVGFGALARCSPLRTFYLLHRTGLQGLVGAGYESFQVPEYSGDFLHPDRLLDMLAEG